MDQDSYLGWSILQLCKARILCEQLFPQRANQPEGKDKIHMLGTYPSRQMMPVTTFSPLALPSSGSLSVFPEHLETFRPDSHLGSLHACSLAQVLDAEVKNVKMVRWTKPGASRKATGLGEAQKLGREVPVNIWMIPASPLNSSEVT